VVDVRGLVMTGKLDDFRLADVLQVVGLSRQYTAVELRRDDGTVHGTIYVKAGRVVGAERGGVRGRAAFYDMFDPAADSFVVQRLPEPAELGAPLGSLATLLIEGIERAARSAAAPARPRDGVAKGSGVQPLPARRGRSVAIAITSPDDGVGRTTVTLNLALAVAQRGRRTIAIDADPSSDLVRMLGRGHVLAARDVLDDPDEIDDALCDTDVDGLQVLPVGGPARRGRADDWRAVIARARERAELVLVDCPAGMFDATADVLQACTHMVGVLPSEMSAIKSALMLESGLAAMHPAARPQMAGVVINMFQARSAASMEAFQRIAAGPPGRFLFETTIPRSDVFAAASLAGVPVRFAEPEGGANPIAWLFEALASEVCGRTGLGEAAAAMPTRLR